MSAACEAILGRLNEVGFQVRAGGLAPFGEDLPLVGGVAWDAGTAQLAVVAEMDSDADQERWRQLLFACSGLRHHLRSDAPAAFGTPVVLAVVDDDGQRAMRALVEDLVQRYALFSRVDINLVQRSALDRPAALDLALAPLLPCCRTMLGAEISRAEVRRFWGMLRLQVIDAARNLDARFGVYRERAGSTLADEIVGESARDDELPPPTPIWSLTIDNFRSFAHAPVELRQATVVHGTNGSGKSTLLEALDLLWASTSQRKPWDASTDEYERHLPRNGEGVFAIFGDDLTVASLDTAPRADLGRCVLTQELVAAVANSRPEARYEQLLALTGLEIPELDQTTARLRDDAKRAADVALGNAGLAAMPTKNTVALAHLSKQLDSAFASRLPAADSLATVEASLSDAADGAFEARSWADDERAAAALARADDVVAEAIEDPTDDTYVIDALDAAAEAVRELAEPRQAAARALRRLVDALAAPAAVQRRGDPREDGPVPTDLAVRWNAHVGGLHEAAAGFRAELGSVSDPRWQQRLADYADALDTVAAGAPRSELQRWMLSGQSGRPEAIGLVPDELFFAAGFARRPATPEVLLPHLRVLAERLQSYLNAIDGLVAELERHPARLFGEHAPRILEALCRYELTRTLRRKTPVVRAGEQLIAELLQDRLLPIVRELMAALVRFEWYFKPLQIPDAGRKVIFAGLATDRDDLDASMTLNSAERTVLGLAWFLALHLLQPAERRQVLVLDDPTAAFDTSNQAGFVSTLRAFVRLTRPEQVIVTTHDDGLAASIAEELAPVNGWPSAVARLRCQRTGDDASIVEPEWWCGQSRDTEREEGLLGLAGESTLFA